MILSDLSLLPQPRRLELLGGVATAEVTPHRATVKSLPRQGYRLTIRPQQVLIESADAAGEFYARQTLAQVRSQCEGKSIPCLEIEDWPDYPVRGAMLDISRDKVPTMATLYALVDLLASWKINHLQLYTEHTFAYDKHPEVWATASPMTAEEIRALDAYCRARFIELVPNQNSLGHLERWLKLPQYRDLAEAPEGFDWPWGERHEGGFSLCPTDPRSLELVAGWYEELLPNFTSRLFNVGCDETLDIGQGRSRSECERRGRERVYLEWLLKIHALVQRHGRRMQFWGDIILQRPELIRELPRDVIALEWGYEADHPFDEDGAKFAEAGIPFYICPGTSSWCSISGRTDNAMANLRHAAAAGLKHGAIGYLNTDWGDLGHLQYLPVSYLGLAGGAAMSWCLQSNTDLPLADRVSMYAFDDRSGTMGRVAAELGNVYQHCGKLIKNGSLLFWLLVSVQDEQRKTGGFSAEGLAAAEAAIEAAIRPLGGRNDLAAQELRAAAQMLRHACGRGRWRLNGCPQSVELSEQMRQIIAEHERLWRARNRPGGLVDSCSRLWRVVGEYERGR